MKRKFKRVLVHLAVLTVLPAAVSTIAGGDTSGDTRGPGGPSQNPGQVQCIQAPCP